MLYSCVGGLEYFDCDLMSDRFVMLLFSDNLQAVIKLMYTHYLLPLEMRFINEPNEGHIRVHVQCTYNTGYVFTGVTHFFYRKRVSW